jgi:hypothetical protein
MSGPMFPNQPRIENLQYQECNNPLVAPNPAYDTTNLFFDGPDEFLVKAICKLLLADPVWPQFFADRIDPYRRMDYSIRELPALRIYTEGDEKMGESWFINGDIKADVIFPASIRRNETQQLQNTLASALLQQFRRPAFFTSVNTLVPGLNELGKIFKSDKSLGFAWNEEYVPLTQLTLNYRIDLRQWDDYLEATGRTKDSPFSPVLADLRRISADIQALRDDGTEDVDTPVNQGIAAGPPLKTPRIF